MRLKEKEKLLRIRKKKKNMMMMKMEQKRIEKRKKAMKKDAVVPNIADSCVCMQLLLFPAHSVPVSAELQHRHHKIAHAALLQ